MGETEDVSFEVSNASVEDLELVLSSPSETLAGANREIQQVYTLNNNGNTGTTTTNVQV